MNAVMMTKMTSDDLIDELQSELNNINADKVDDYEQSYIWIRSRVNKLAASDYPLYKDLEDYFEDFIQWEDVRERLLAAVEDRDSSTLGFLTRQVDWMMNIITLTPMASYSILMRTLFAI